MRSLVHGTRIARRHHQDTDQHHQNLSPAQLCGGSSQEVRFEDDYMNRNPRILRYRNSAPPTPTNERHFDALLNQAGTVVKHWHRGNMIETGNVMMGSPHLNVDQVEKLGVPPAYSYGVVEAQYALLVTWSLS